MNLFEASEIPTKASITLSRDQGISDIGRLTAFAIPADQVKISAWAVLKAMNGAEARGQRG
jgi:hypothetical protein